MATEQIRFEMTFPLQSALDNIEFVLGAVSEGFIGRLWREDVNKTNRIEVYIDEDEPPSTELNTEDNHDRHDSAGGRRAAHHRSGEDVPGAGRFPGDSATDGTVALQRILNEKPSLVVLDLMLPGMDGWEVCRRVRAQSDVPIIMLTARDDDIDKIVGLELGADDYLTKPFNPRELMARVKAILRRANSRAPEANLP